MAVRSFLYLTFGSLLLFGVEALIYFALYGSIEFWKSAGVTPFVSVFGWLYLSSSKNLLLGFGVVLFLHFGDLKERPVVRRLIFGIACLIPLLYAFNSLLRPVDINFYLIPFLRCYYFSTVALSLMVYLRVEGFFTRRESGNDQLLDR